SYQTYAAFSDPDGNEFLLQEITTRLPGREWEGAGVARRYSALENQRFSAANGVSYSYRDTGSADGTGGVPLVLLQHFRGNLDNWDPALIDALDAPGRRVIA